MWHVTARMAWHDRGWDGKICNDPAGNTYCTGTHSLLSERLAREKRAHLENPEDKLDSKLPEYLPPCFWTSCAFSAKSTKVIHRHPFGYLRDKKQISTELHPNSVYTWPFRLSMTHNSHKKHGQYFPDLEERIDRYRGRLIKGKSLVFFYLNYDNPVSADEYRYALVGCARLSGIDLAGSFSFTQSEWKQITKGEGMQNFPKLNWAMQLTHEGPGHFVRLPYPEYVQRIAEHPEDEPKLNEIRVLIEEPALLPGFKYVSEQVNDDHALALLYKLKRAFAKVAEHGLVDGDNELKLLDEFIEETWSARGLYPGLGSVISVLADLAEGEPQKASQAGQQLVDAIRGQLKAEDDLLKYTFSLLGDNGAPPKELSKYKSTIRDARAGLRDNNGLLQTLQKLSLFALTSRQVARILFPDADGPHAFGGRKVTPNDVAKNPYLLSESYVPATEDDKEQRADLDREQRTDGPIDYFTIDVGMFPDKRYVERNDSLQDLTVAGPERLRAFAIEALHQNEVLGHTFAPLGILVEEATSHPLFYRDSIALRDEQFLTDAHLAHFRQRLFIKELDGQYFFYLQETKDAENIVSRFVMDRMALPDLKPKLDWLDAYLDKEANELQGAISGFDAPGFKAERRQLMEYSLRRRIFCVTGRPGSGKTEALHALLYRLEQAGESATVLAPTGKAALRLNSATQPGTTWRAQTLDRWIYQSGFAHYLGGEASLAKMTKSDRYEPADNFVIDEMSMVDLGHLALLFRALEIHQPGTIKRIILVGDENQLPPIGCGRPFFDIISYFREDAAREKGNLVRLTTNCRQQHDRVVLDAAHLFAGKNRYHTDLYEKLLRGGKISPFLEVNFWQDKNDLQNLITDYLDGVLSDIPNREKLSRQQAFNQLLGLYENGYVPKNDARQLRLDRAQLLTPYRGGPSGSLGLSDFVRSTYRHDAWPDRKYKSTSLGHSDKIIRIKNLYGWDSTLRRRELRLSNGSIGVICNNLKERKSYFPESTWPIDWNDVDEEDFELAYGITVHKAQGSEFQEVLVVLPERQALLSRELVYTALTRSRTKLHLLVQKPRKASQPNPLQIARDRSVIIGRNSSTFSDPFDSRRVFQPEPGKNVKSKIEYLIYEELRQARDAGKLAFEYEQELELPIGGRPIRVKPDFTIHYAGRTFYWEHLGMLDRADYSGDWRDRVAGYRAKGLEGVLVTTDDLSGIRRERLQQVIADLLSGTPAGDGSTEFSRHHYTL